MWFCYVWYVLLSASTSLSKKSCSSILKAKLSPAQKCITLFQLKRGLHTSILDILDFVGSNAGSVALGKLSFTCQCRVSEMVLMSSPKGKFVGLSLSESWNSPALTSCGRGALFHTSPNRCKTMSWPENSVHLRVCSSSWLHCFHGVCLKRRDPKDVTHVKKKVTKPLHHWNTMIFQGTNSCIVCNQIALKFLFLKQLQEP